MQSRGCHRENNSRNYMELIRYTCSTVFILWPNIWTVISQDNNTKGCFQVLHEGIRKSVEFFVRVVRALRPRFEQSHSKPSGGIRNQGEDSDFRLNHLSDMYWKFFRLKSYKAHSIVDTYNYLGGWQVNHEPAVWSGCQAGQWHPGMH